MKTIQVAEAIGPALNYLVAVCEEILGLDNADAFLRDHKIGFSTRYSTNWSVGGPIIEREDIAISPLPDGLCRAYIPEGTRVLHGRETFIWKHKGTGYTYLIAAMRCYVASKLGDTAEVPEELT